MPVGVAVEALSTPGSERYAHSLREGGDLCDGKGPDGDRSTASRVETEAIPPIGCPSGTAGQDHQDPVLIQSPGQRQQRLTRRDVGPVEVFHHDDDRPAVFGLSNMSEELKAGDKATPPANRRQLVYDGELDVGRQLIGRRLQHAHLRGQPG